MTRIVFSKDRALQLHAFLRSYHDHVAPLETILVLYLATSERHQRAYNDVFQLFPFAKPYLQSVFRYDLISMMPETGAVIMFADDHLFLRPWLASEDEVGTNLHLGLNLTHCYTLNRPQPVPIHTLIDPDKLTWRWGSGIGDWGYPLCPCGQVYEAEALYRMLSCVQFTSPNSLEAALQVFAPAFWDSYGKCYRESKLVLLPWNLVQTDCVNRIAPDLPTADQLLGRWEAGYQVDVAPLYGVLNESLHQELPLVLEPR